MGNESFEELAAVLDYPMFVITAQAEDKLAGCLVGFTSQVSINPSRFLVGLSKRNHTFRIAEDATHLGVHLLGREQLDLARMFGSQTGDTFDKFAHCAWRHGPEQVPILNDADAWFVGRVLDRVPLGDHVGHLLEPVAGDGPQKRRQWVSFSDVRDLEPGNEA